MEIREGLLTIRPVPGHNGGTRALRTVRSLGAQSIENMSNPILDRTIQNIDWEDWQ
jgi:hypothetical protein